MRALNRNIWLEAGCSPSSCKNLFIQLVLYVRFVLCVRNRISHGKQAASTSCCIAQLERHAIRILTISLITGKVPRSGAKHYPRYRMDDQGAPLQATAGVLPICVSFQQKTENGVVGPLSLIAPVAPNFVRLRTIQALTVLAW